MSEEIYMLNALWFKPSGGREKYLEYGAAVAPLIQKTGAEVQHNYGPQESLIGDFNPDVFFVVKYPSKEAFDAMINSTEYQAIMHLREEALEKSLLTMCKSYDWA